jgi:hypothetical protein
LLEVALPVSLKLATVIEVEGTEASYKKLEYITEDGVVRGLKMAFGGNVDVLRVWFI